MSMENHGGMTSTELLIHPLRALWQFYQQSSGSKHEEQAKETRISVLRNIFFISTSDKIKAYDMGPPALLPL
jgi:hypothetical protein